MLTGPVNQLRLPQGLADTTKVAVVDLLHRHRVDGTTALPGLDGTAHGVRGCARFFGRNPASR
jgi:hypothetical protein